MQLPLTTAQAAKKRGVTRARILTLIYNGRLKATKVGSQHLIDPADLDKLVIGKVGRPPKVKAEKTKHKGR